MQGQPAFLKKSSKLQKPKRILVIRSAARIFNHSVESLKNEFPNAHITVLTPESNRKNLEQDPMVDNVISMPSKHRMNLFNCGSDLRHRLRSQKFDLAVSLYNVEHGIGYSNIDLLAWSTKPREIRGYNSKGSSTLLSSMSIFQKIVCEKTSAIWIIVNIFATIMLFTCVTLGILVESLFRKIFQRKNLK